MNLSSLAPRPDAHDEFAKRITARLASAETDLPYDITERLRAARARAVQDRKQPVAFVSSNASIAMGGQNMSLGERPPGFWGKFAATLPLAALLLGLFFIQSIQGERRVSELAEIDSALLTDDLPPAAYADPGFAHFLKTHTAPSP